MERYAFPEINIMGYSAPSEPRHYVTWPETPQKVRKGELFKTPSQLSASPPLCCMGLGQKCAESEAPCQAASPELRTRWPNGVSVSLDAPADSHAERLRVEISQEEQGRAPAQPPLGASPFGPCEGLKA